MRDNYFQIVEELKQKMNEALDRYYEYNGHDLELAEKAHMEYNQLKHKLYHLTGEFETE
jgi:hypothetical protein